MDEVFGLWDQLLQELATQTFLFLHLLSVMLVSQLAAPMDKLYFNYALRTKAYGWLEHIYTSDCWHTAIKRHGAAEKDIIGACLKNPNQWTIPLASAITQCSSRDPIREFFGPLVAEASEGITVSRRRLPRPQECAEGEARIHFHGWQRFEATRVS